MARSHIKCSLCGDLLWFEDDSPSPQAVECSCLQTTLAEEGPSGAYEELTEEEISSLT
jgi:hypothetical protein